MKKYINALNVAFGGTTGALFVFIVSFIYWIWPNAFEKIQISKWVAILLLTIIWIIIVLVFSKQSIKHKPLTKVIRTSISNDELFLVVNYNRIFEEGMYVTIIYDTYEDGFKQLELGVGRVKGENASGNIQINFIYPYEDSEVDQYVQQIKNNTCVLKFLVIKPSVSDVFIRSLNDNENDNSQDLEDVK